MSWFPFQHDVLEHAVAAAVPAYRVRLSGIQYQLSLEGAALLSAGSYIEGLVPALDVLIHWLAVEEDQRHALRFGFVNDHRRRSPVYDVHTQHVTAPRKEAVYLSHLGGLVASAIGDQQRDFLPNPALLLLCKLLQALRKGRDERIILRIKGHADPETVILRRIRPAGGEKHQRQRQDQRVKK